MSEKVTYRADAGEPIDLFARRLADIRALTRTEEVSGMFNGIRLTATPHKSDQDVIQQYHDLSEMRRSALAKLSPEEREVLGL